MMKQIVLQTIQPTPSTGKLSQRCDFNDKSFGSICYYFVLFLPTATLLCSSPLKLQQQQTVKKLIASSDLYMLVSYMQNIGII